MTKTKAIVKSTMQINGLAIPAYKDEKGQWWVNLSVLAKAKNANLPPAEIIKKWMRTQGAIDLLISWETSKTSDDLPVNPDFNLAISGQIQQNAALGSELSPRQWIRKTHAIGLRAGAGSQSEGVWAHEEIAIAFAMWISSDYQLFVIREFNRLKKEEKKRAFEALWKEISGFNEKRLEASLGYHVHTEAVYKNRILPFEDILTQDDKNRIFGQEGNLPNIALWNKKAKAWKQEHPEYKKNDNQRNHASDPYELEVVKFIEIGNAELLNAGKSYEERLAHFKEEAPRLLNILRNSRAAKKLAELRALKEKQLELV